MELKGHAKLTFPMDPLSRGFVPLRLELDRRENNARSGRITAPAQELPGGSEMGGQIVRELLGTLLQNRCELGPLGLIGVNPGQYRVGVDAAGVELGSLAAALARLGAAELPSPRPPAWSSRRSAPASAAIEHSPANHSAYRGRFERL